MDDSARLRAYCENHSEDAFAALVRRHIHLVYSVARRQAGHPQNAEEITQAVFIILAQKAAGLRHEKALSSWLFQVTLLTANNFIRSEMRRHRRDQKAYMQSTLNESGAGAWKEIPPLLDTAVNSLHEKDRRAIMLRFYEGRNLREVGLALGANEEVAKKRVARAIGKLQRFFLRRGVTSSAQAITSAVSAYSTQTAPAGLAHTVSAVALAGGAMTSASTLTHIKGALKLMAWTKAKTAAIAGTMVLLAAVTATITAKKIQEHRTYPWQVEPFDFKLVDRQPPQVRILPSKWSSGDWDKEPGPEGKMMGIGVTAEQIVLRAYGVRPTRAVFRYEAASATYDFIASLPDGNRAALQQELRRKLGIVAHHEMLETNVLVLTVDSLHAPGLKPSANPNGASDFSHRPGRISVRNGDLSQLVALMQGQFRRPIVDRTGLTNHLDIDLHWNDADQTFHDPAVLEQVKRDLMDQLGLELTPAFEAVDMLMVDKAG